MSSPHMEIESRLRRSFRALAPDRADELLQQEVVPADGGEWYLEKAVSRRQTTAVRRLSVLAACLVLIFTGVLSLLPRAAATVYLDVNPSLSLTVDNSDRVLRVQAGNDDGAAVMQGLALKRQPVETALDALVGSMVEQGYLTEDKNVILLSVAGRDGDTVEELRRRLARELDRCLVSRLGSAAVFDQAVGADSELEELSRSLNVSPGKAALIRSLSADHGELDQEELARLPLSDLADYLQRQGIELEDYARFTGEKRPAADAEDGDRDEDRDDGEDEEDEDDEDDEDDDDDDRPTPVGLSGSSSGSGAPALTPDDRDDDEGDRDDVDEDKEDDDDRDEGPAPAPSDFFDDDDDPPAPAGRDDDDDDDEDDDDDDDEDDDD